MRDCGWDSQDGHLHPVFAHEIGQLVHAQHRLSGFPVAFTGRVDIESGDDFEAFLLETAIGKQRQAEMAGADEHNWLQPGCAQQIGDHRGQLFDVVSQASRAELAEVSQVFAQLRGLDAGRLGEGLA